MVAAPFSQVLEAFRVGEAHDFHVAHFWSPPLHFRFGIFAGVVLAGAFPTRSVWFRAAHKPPNKSLDSNAMTGGVCREVVMVLSHGVGQLLRSAQDLQPTRKL